MVQEIIKDVQGGGRQRLMNAVQSLVNHLSFIGLD